MADASVPGTVLFDLDGTFADTLQDLGRALEAALAERGLPAISHADLRPHVSRGARAMAEWAIAEGAGGAGVDSDDLDELVARFLDLYLENVARRTRLVDGMEDVIDALDRHAVPWGIVTNKRRRWAEPLMAALDPEGRAGCLVCGDSTANAKPHPQPLLHACRLMDTTPRDCVYVGDAENDVVAARRAGMRSVIALYGYIAEEDDPRAWRADATIDAPGDLLAWLRID